jgi:hypothetical protein
MCAAAHLRDGAVVLDENEVTPVTEGAEAGLDGEADRRPADTAKAASAKRKRRLMRCVAYPIRHAGST